MSVASDLKSLAEDLYLQGYHCGISDDRSYEAWALAMEKVCAGESYTKDLVYNCYKELFEGE